jgi:hypothetical protein
VAELGSIPENTGRPLAELRADPVVASLPRFGEVDMALLAALEGAAGAGENGSWPLKLNGVDFVEWITYQRVEQTVVLVSHSNYLGQLLPRLQGPAAIPNCEPVVVAVDSLCRLRCAGPCGVEKLKDGYTTRGWKQARKGSGWCKDCHVAAGAAEEGRRMGKKRGGRKGVSVW